MPLVFATRNQGKLVELRELVTGIDVIDVAEAAHRLGREIPDVVEDADTFVGNAIKKAREVSAATGWPALADDSGLEVDALGGAPGVHSARYASEPTGEQVPLGYASEPTGEQVPLGCASEHHDAPANNRKLLAALAGVTNRSARFRCSLALADVRGRLGEQTITADGTCEGAILDAPRGAGGFGYDPLFLLPNGHTMAELDHAAKNAISHRGLAMKGIEARLRAYLAG